MANNALVDAKYRSYYKRRRPEDEDMMGVPWPNYTGGSGFGGSGGGGGGIGNAGGFAGGSNALLSSFGSNQMATPGSEGPQEPGDGGNQGEGGPSYGQEGTLDDAITGMLGTLPIGPLSLLGFLGLSEKEQAQKDIDEGKNTDRARFGRSLGMTPNLGSDMGGVSQNPGGLANPGVSQVGQANDPYGGATGLGQGGETGYSGPGVDQVSNTPDPFGGSTGLGQGGEGSATGDASSGGTGTDSGQGGPPGGWAYGGIVDPGELSGPDPAGPDEGYGALRVGEGVLRPEAVELLGPDFVHTVNALAGLISSRRAGNALIG
jgi:hypothetical protein